MGLVKIGNTDYPDFPLLGSFRHSPVHIGSCLVGFLDEQQVYILHVQGPERLNNGRLCPNIAGVRGIGLGCHKQLLMRDAAAAQGAAQFRFIAPSARCQSGGSPDPLRFGQRLRIPCRGADKVPCPKAAFPRRFAA